MEINRLLVSKKELKTLGIPYSFQHIARLEKAGSFPGGLNLAITRLLKLIVTLNLPCQKAG